MGKRDSQKINIAVIGCGEQAVENLLPSLMQIEDASIIALCDIDEVKALRAANLFPNACAYKDYVDIFSIQDLDAVVLAGPPQMHFEATQLALRNGKHVFVEKPPTVTTNELQQLASLADSNNLITVVGHNMRYATACLEMQRLVSNESFGNILSMDVRYLAAQPRGTRWGLDSVLRSFLLSHAIHALDLLIAYMGQVSALSAKALELNNEAILVSALFQFSSGMIGTLITGTCGTHFQIDVHLISDTSRVVHVENLRKLTAYGYEGDTKRWGRVWEPRPLEGGYARSGYLGELTSFVTAIQHGNQTQPSLRDEIAVYQLMDEIEFQVTRELASC
ncbi:MAG: Gfo/Idh/MocA family oxidoreductase [Chitinophagaceae bacterium]